MKLIEGCSKEEAIKVVDTNLAKAQQSGKEELGIKILKMLNKQGTFESFFVVLF